MTRTINTDKIHKLIVLLTQVQDELGSCPLVPLYTERRFEEYESRMADVDDALLIRFAKAVCLEDSVSVVHDRTSALECLWHQEYDYSRK